MKDIELMVLRHEVRIHERQVHTLNRGRERPSVGRSHGHARGTPMAIRRDFQLPPMRRMTWPPSVAH